MIANTPNDTYTPTAGAQPGLWSTGNAMVSYKGGPIGLLLGLFCVVRSAPLWSRAAPRGLGPGSNYIRLSGLQDKPV